MKFWAKRKKSAELTFFQKTSLFFYDRPRFSISLWLVIFVFGILSYTTFLKREGFPSVQVPFTVITGSYLVDDPQKVDDQLVRPISEEVLKQPKVKTLQSSAQANFFNLFVQYETGTDSDRATENLKQAVAKAGVIPKEAEVEFEKPRFGITERGDDVVISFFAPAGDKTTAELKSAAEEAVDFLKKQNLTLIQDISTIDPFVSGVDPATGQEAVRQTGFDRYGQRQNNQNHFYNSIIIGATTKKGADILKVDKQLNSAVDNLNAQTRFQDYQAVLSATFADDIRFQINELQKALLEGLLAVLFVGAVVIAVRASIITVLSMLSVLAITIGTLFLIGYSLNTITLFALILGLALIVDDTIIMVEAIDTQRRKTKDGRKAVKTATRKVGRAMTAATSTAALSFAPLLFAGGILGSFIRAIPVTIIISLITSLLVALIFIPRFARSLMLSKKMMGPKGETEIAEGVETAIAHAIARPMLWAKGSTKRMVLTGLVAIIIGFGFVGAGGWLFSKVTFNIFPSGKDSNQLMVSLTYPPGTDIHSAQDKAKKAESVITRELSDNFVLASYYGTGNDRTSQIVIDITPYEKRDIRAPQLVDQLEQAFSGFKEAQIKVGEIGVGPPAPAFGVQIKTDDAEAAYRLADDISAFLDGVELERISGEKARITRTSISNPAAVTRVDGDRYVEVSAEFDDDDTTTLVSLAQNAIKTEFDAQRLAQYGLDDDVLDFNLGGEEDNQESFQTLITAFPILMAIIYILLAFQFRSILQPALIFLAIPFSVFGIALGLYLTDNPFSFFAMLGFFALIGLSIKNTILLTDYANQARAAGLGAVDSTVAALEERFRPLIATSLTAVFSLIPLAILSPFWEGLVVVLIFGLLSSTFLVVTVFPYYYLGAEYLRRHISRKSFFVWLSLNLGVGYAASKVLSGSAVLPVLITLNIMLLIWKQFKKNK